MKLTNSFLEILAGRHEYSADFHGACIVCGTSKSLHNQETVIIKLIEAVKKYNAVCVGEALDEYSIYDSPDYKPGDGDKVMIINNTRREIIKNQEENL
jgi:hypothetical protein